jgi:hypothetical protein
MPSDLTIHDRAYWGARDPGKGRGTQAKSKVHELFIHHVGDEPMRHVVTTVHEEVAQLRAIQAYHMDVHGWLDIGYSYVLCPPWGRSTRAGNIYTGRGFGVVPAGQLDHNEGTIALLVMAGGDDPVDNHLLKRLRSFKRWADEQAGHSLDVRPHSAVTATTCPGAHLRAAIHLIQSA